MKDLVLFDVVEENNACWKLAIIKKINGGGKCAISKTEPIGYKELYYYKGELNYSDVKQPPIGSYKVISMYYWFHKIATKPGTRILFECEPIKSLFRIKYPLNVKKKQYKRKHKKRVRLLAS